MSLWKSPILYLTALLFAVVGAALLAPVIIDWNAYRGTFADLGTTITGRKVAFNGPIAVRLFPWPRLEASNVTIANAQGFGTAPLAAIQRLRMDLALAGLFSGQVRIEAVELAEVKFNLQVDPSGNGNWILTPDKSTHEGAVLQALRLNAVRVRNGAIEVIDARHKFQRSFKNVQADIAGDALQGPWRGQGSGSVDGHNLDFNFGYTADKSNKLSFRVSAQDGFLPAVAFDGEGANGAWNGNVRLEPVVTTNGKSSLVGAWRPVVFTAKAALQGDNLALNEIHITPADVSDNAPPIDGSGRIDLSKGVAGSFKLTTSRLDLDRFLPAVDFKSETAGIGAFLNGLMQKMPDSATLDLEGEATTASAAGEDYDSVKLDASLAKGVLRVRDLTLGLPGRTRAKFSGLAFQGNSTVEFGGKVALEAGDAKAAASWAWPQAVPAITQFWTGLHGHLKLQGDLNFAKDRLSLVHADYELDNNIGQGGIDLTLGAVPSLSVTLSANELALGDYVPTQFPLLAARALVPGLSPGETGMQKNLSIKVGKLAMNGVSAQNVAIDMNASAAGFEMKRFDLGNVAGAQVRGVGLVVNGANGQDGEVKFAVTAPQPQGLLRILGALPDGPDPVWAKGFGATDLHAEVAFKPSKSEPQVSFSVTGASGPYRLVGSGTASDLAGADGATIGLSANVNTADARALLQLMGVEPKGAAAGDGQLSITVFGKAAQGYKAVAEFSGVGATANFKGNIKPQAAGTEIEGNFNLLSDNPAFLIQALGAPVVGLPSLSVTAHLLPVSPATAIENLVLRLGPQEIKGGGSIARDGQLKLDLVGGDLRGSDLAALAFANWVGEARWPGVQVGAGWPLAVKGSVQLRPRLVTLPFFGDVAGATITVANDAEGQRLAISQNGIELDAQLRHLDKGLGLTGHISAPVRLEQIFAAATPLPTPVSGSGRVQLKFASSALGAQALLAAATGEGEWALGPVQIAALSPDGLYANLDGAHNAEAVAQAMRSLTQGGTVQFPPQNSKVFLRDGAIIADGIEADTTRGHVTLSGRLDLASAQVAASISVTDKTHADLPAVKLNFAGPLGAVSEKLDGAALATKLGAVLIAKDVAALDQVQKDMAAVKAQNEADKAKLDAAKLEKARAAIDAAVTYGNAILPEELQRLKSRLPH